MSSTHSSRICVSYRWGSSRICGEHANVCVFMTYLQQNLLAYPEHLSMLQNPIQHWFSCFSLHQFCFCLAGCHDALRPRRHTACSFSPPTSDSQEISLKNNLSCDGMCGMIGISQASCVCSIEVRPMGRRRFVGLLQFDKTQRTAGPCCPCLYLGKSRFVTNHKTPT